MVHHVELTAQAFLRERGVLLEDVVANHFEHFDMVTIELDHDLCWARKALQSQCSDPDVVDRLFLFLLEVDNLNLGPQVFIWLQLFKQNLQVLGDSYEVVFVEFIVALDSLQCQLVLHKQHVPIEVADLVLLRLVKSFIQFSDSVFFLQTGVNLLSVHLKPLVDLSLEFTVLGLHFFDIVLKPFHV